MDRRPFLNAASAGLAALAGEAASGLKRLLGPVAYFAGALWSGLTGRPIACSVTADGAPLFEGKAWQVTDRRHRVVRRRLGARRRQRARWPAGRRGPRGRLAASPHRLRVRPARGPPDRTGRREHAAGRESSSSWSGRRPERGRRAGRGRAARFRCTRSCGRSSSSCRIRRAPTRRRSSRPRPRAGTTAQAAAGRLPLEGADLAGVELEHDVRVAVRREGEKADRGAGPVGDLVSAPFAAQERHDRPARAPTSPPGFAGSACPRARSRAPPR